jgi:hypothetical protein
MRKTFCILEWRQHPHGFFVGEVVIHPKLPTGGWHLRPVSMHLK